MSKRNPMPPERRDETFRRDNYTCQARAYGWPMISRCEPHTLVVHHRRVQGMGGSLNDTIHDLEILVSLCGLHHREIHNQPATAYQCGLMVRR